jgi:hypothetical protein
VYFSQLCSLSNPHSGPGNTSSCSLQMVGKSLDLFHLVWQEIHVPTFQFVGVGFFLSFPV